MKRYIFTGAPGSGKTVLIRQLEADGFSVVEEAATDIIALHQAKGVEHPWTQHSFTDDIADLQRQRLVRSSHEQCAVQFHDRSVFCTAALADFLGHARSHLLSHELERVVTERVYQPEVFFLRGLGFVKPTAARRISVEDAVRFELVHEKTYKEFGFRIIAIESASPRARADKVTALVQEMSESR